MIARDIHMTASADTNSVSSTNTGIGLFGRWFWQLAVQMQKGRNALNQLVLCLFKQFQELLSNGGDAVVDLISVLLWWMSECNSYVHNGRNDHVTHEINALRVMESTSDNSSRGNGDPKDEQQLAHLVHEIPTHNAAAPQQTAGTGNQ